MNRSLQQLSVTREVESFSTPEQALLLFCKATADQIRLSILMILDRESFGVLELCHILELKQSALSHHLKILTDAELLIRRREGNSIFYSRNYHLAGPMAELYQSFYQMLSSMELEPCVKVRVRQLQEKRAERSRQFFEQHLDRFSANQELVAPVAAYQGQLMDMILSADQSEMPPALLEIGPGEGHFLPVLATHFESIDAVDNSAMMLNSARDWCQRQGVDGINFYLGDSQCPELQRGHYQMVVMNMVLHHIPSPMDILQDIWQLLQPGGLLFVSELCSHQQDWVRDACGDIWLGFEPDDLTRMAKQAGFSEGPGQYLAQRNGFVVQLRQLIKQDS